MTSYSTAPGTRISSRSKKPSNYAKYIEEYQQQVIHLLYIVNSKIKQEAKVRNRTSLRQPRIIFRAEKR
jgi:hypothetical protein